MGDNEPKQCADNAKAPNFETKVFIKGRDAASMTDDEIFRVIRDMQNQANQLGEMRDPPKKLLEKIVKLNEDIKSIGAYVDAR